MDDPGCTLAGLAGRKSARADEPADDDGVDRTLFGDLRQDQLAALLTLTLAMDANAARLPEAAHRALGPTVALAGLLAQAVEQSGNQLVGQHAGQIADQRSGLGIGGPPVLAGAVAGHHQMRVVAALPVLSVTAYMEPFHVRLNGATPCSA